MKDIHQLMGDPDWPGSTNHIYLPAMRPVLSYPPSADPPRRVEELQLQRLLSEKLLFISGPRNSGKRALAISVAKKWHEDKGILRLRWADCLADMSLQDEVSLGQLRQENELSEPFLYVFTDCESLLPQFGNTWYSFFGNLKNVHLILTASEYLQDIQHIPVCGWMFTAHKTLPWVADKTFVREVLVASETYDNVRMLQQDLDNYFYTAFEGSKGSADLSLVREFLRSGYKSIGDWWKTRQAAARTPVVDGALRKSLCELLRQEQVRVNQISERISNKKLGEIFVKRVPRSHLTSGSV